MSIDGHLPTQSHQEGLAQFHSIARDVEDLKKGKSSATIEERVGDNLGGFNSPHHQMPFYNVSTYGYHNMPVQNSHPFHEVGYQGRPQFRGGRRGEEFPRYEAWYDNNFYDDYGDNPNAKQLKSQKDQIEQEKFQGLNFDVNFDFQDFMGLAF
ncbi:hypothetical protein M9H77_29664 [Catharanthus roseus]|uniref:Uncharacterized protein n=1 Tax=Catharanthus roseus TaxID=4058 RepID=A0ACB9ZWD0_CATRO|nr:hypothetical protein M9H77_29664 [Catharanthus roseus]